jgi:hypothetical protein
MNNRLGGMRTRVGHETLLNDVHGRITRVAVQVESKLLNDEYLDRRQAYEALLRSFRAEMTLLVLTDIDVSAKVQQWLLGLQVPCSFEVVEVGKGNVDQSGAWMRDAFLCTTRDGVATYLKPRISKQLSDQADWLAAEDGTNVVDIRDVFLEGGDSLVGPDFRLVGDKAVRTTMSLANYKCDYETAFRRLQNLDERKMYAVGYRKSDIQHKLLWFKDQIRRQTDTILQFESDGPNNLSRTILAVLRATIDAVRATLGSDKLIEDWPHIDLVVSLTGRKRDGKDILLVAKTVLPENARGEELVESERLDALAKYLCDCGFCVKRNPAPYLAPPGRTLWYNNTIIQTDPDIVWLPQFGQPDGSYVQADLANAKIWADLEFEVVPVPSWLAWVPLFGSIRCATSVVGRD